MYLTVVATRVLHTLINVDSRKIVLSVYAYTFVRTSKKRIAIFLTARLPLTLRPTNLSATRNEILKITVRYKRGNYKISGRKMKILLQVSQAFAPFYL